MKLVAYFLIFSNLTLNYCALSLNSYYILSNTKPGLFKNAAASFGPSQKIPSK
jgi:hypothetical protein